MCSPVNMAKKPARASRRITVPEDHVALILPDQLADEMMSLAMASREEHLRGYRAQQVKKPEAAHEHNQRAKILGDFVLALLEAKEA